MALLLKDRVKESTTTTGTGTLTLVAAPSGYRRFSAALSNGDTTYYCIESGSQWEVGLGTYSANTLTRDTVLASSNSGGKINITASRSYVFITYAAEKAVYENAAGEVKVDSALRFSDNSSQSTAFLGAVDYDGIANVPANSLLGNNTGSTGDALALTPSQVRAVLGLATTDAPTFAGLTLTGSISAAAYSASMRYTELYPDGSTGFPIIVYKHRGTYASPTQVLTGDNLGGFTCIGRNASGWNTGPSARIYASALEDFNVNTSRGADLYFDTVSLGGLSTATRLKVGTDLTVYGNLLFGTTNTYDIGDGVYDPRTVRAATSFVGPNTGDTGPWFRGAFTTSGIGVQDDRTTIWRYGTRIFSAGGEGICAYNVSPIGLSRTQTPQVYLYCEGDAMIGLTYPDGTTYGTLNAAAIKHPSAALTLGNSTYGVTFPGQTTCPGTSGDQTERWGKQAAATVYGGTAVGAYANASGYGGTAIGSFATATTNAIAIGHTTFTSQSSVTIGYNAGSATSFQYVAIGQSATPGSNHYCIALGMDAANTAGNQFQIGAATAPITQQRFHTNGGSLTFANETGTFLTAANNGLLTLGNSTYGVTVPGALTVGSNVLVNAAAGFSGYILDMQVDGVSKYRFNTNGAITLPGSNEIYSDSSRIQIGPASNAKFAVTLTETRSVVGYGYSTGVDVNSSLFTVRDAANTLAQRNGTNAQTSRLYNTYTSATSFENLQTSWVSNEARIGTSVGSAGGTQRSFVIGAWDSAGSFTAGMTLAPTGAATFSGDISMSKTSAQGYINIYSPDSSKLLYLYANNNGTGSMVATTNISMSSAGGSVSVMNNQIALSPTSGNAYVYVSGTNSTFDVYDGGGTKYTRLTHDGTNGILNTSSGTLILSPNSGNTSLYKSGSDANLFVVNGANTQWVAVSSEAIATNIGNLSLRPSGGTTAVVTYGDISMQKATQGYIYAYSTGGVNYTRMFDDGTNGVVETNSGDMYLRSNGTAIVNLYSSSANSRLRVFSSSGVPYSQLTHDGTDGILSTSSGVLYLSPANGQVRAYVAGGTAQLQSWDSTLTGFVRMLHYGSFAGLETNVGALQLTAASGVTQLLTGGTNSSLRTYDSSLVKYSQLTHDGTNGILSTSSGALVLSPTTNTTFTTDAYHTGVLYVHKTSGASFVQIGSTVGASHYLEVSGTNGGYVQSNVTSALGSSGTYMALYGNTNTMIMSGAGHVLLNPSNSLIPIMGTTSSFPALKRSSATIEVKLADDSAYANLTCDYITTKTGVNIQSAGVRQSLLYFGSLENRWFSDNNYPMVIESSGGLQVRTTTGGSPYIKLSHDATNGTISTSSGEIILSPWGGTTSCYVSGTNSALFIKGATAAGYIALAHNDTSYGQLAVSTGDLLFTATSSLFCFGGRTSSHPAIKRSSTAIAFRLADDSADAPITAAMATFSKSVLQTAEITGTPSGTTQTLTLNDGNYQTLDLTSSTGDTTVTLTVPTSSSKGSILIKQHATTARDIAWAVSAGSIVWLGTEPSWNADATSSYREVSWRFNGTDMFLSASGVS